MVTMGSNLRIRLDLSTAMRSPQEDISRRASYPLFRHAPCEVAGRPVMKRTSIIIVNWNGIHHLEECLTALLVQTRKPDELIVVDNASSDASAAFVERLYPSAFVVRLEQNRGFSGGNLAGYRICSGDYVILLNNDTKPLPDWLEKLTECADRHPEAGIIASHVTDWEGRYTDSAGDAVNVLGRAHQRFKGKPTNDRLQADHVFSACAGAALYKKEVIEEIGFLDETFFMNVEDTDFAFRAQLRGWRAYFCPDAVVRHKVSASQVAGSRLNIYYNTRNYIWSYCKNMPSGLIAKYGWLLLADLTLKAFTAAINGTFPAFVAGLFDGIKGIAARLPERRRIQASRLVSLSELEASLTYPRLLQRITGKA